MKKFLLAAVAAVGLFAAYPAFAQTNPPPSEEVVCAEGMMTQDEIVALVYEYEAQGIVTDVLFLDTMADVDDALLYIESNGGDIEGLLGVADAAIFYWPTDSDYLMAEGFYEGCHLGYAEWSYEEIGLPPSSAE